MSESENVHKQLFSGILKFCDKWHQIQLKKQQEMKVTSDYALQSRLVPYTFVNQKEIENPYFEIHQKKSLKFRPKCNTHKAGFSENLYHGFVPIIIYLSN